MSKGASAGKKNSQDCEEWEAMSRDEVYNWIFAVVSVIGLITYLAILIPRIIGTPASEVSYVAPLLWVFGTGMVVGFGVALAVRLASPKETKVRDERDKEIELIGQYVGSAFVTMGAIAALVLSILEVDHFWVSNSLFVGFLLAAVLSTFAKAAAYRGEYPEI
ncbi:MAG: hypothetical protein JW722_07230 [Demequinaceae bacterium]|nr:hypothetical protein [Demequinaceae bacterium]